MNLFVVGWSPQGPVDAGAGEWALRKLLERLPFFQGEPVETWTAASGTACAACVAHPPDQTGGVRYHHFDPEHLALFSGRPIRWAPDGSGEGRGPLVPGHYLHPPETWMRDLDGRCVAVRCCDGPRTLEVFSDPMGAYPVYTTEVGPATWISNNAEALRLLSGSDEQSTEALAGMLGGGWSLSGHPRWAAVRRLDRGVLYRLAPGAKATRIELLPNEQIVAQMGAGLDARAAAGTLTQAVKALANWTGRPSMVPVTGGRDSRLVLAAALRADLDFEAITGGEPQSPDVTIGRELAERAGVRHSLIPDDPHGNVFSDWRRAARVLDLTSSGTASLADAAGFPLGPRPGPLPLWHSGQGGEIARGYYGAGVDDAASRLYRAFVGRRPGRHELLSEDGARVVRGEIDSWADEQRAAGAKAEDLPDLFYLLKRMGTWAGPSHGCVEFVRDTTSPLWSRRMLYHELGLPARERSRELFHRRVLEALDRELADIGYESPAHAGRARTFMRKAFRELRRRRAAAAGTTAGDDPFARILPEIRETVLSQPDHAAWPLLDRERVEKLLAAEAATLDTMSRYYAWRLATVFGATA